MVTQYYSAKLVTVCYIIQYATITEELFVNDVAIKQLREE